MAYKLRAAAIARRTCPPAVQARSACGGHLRLQHDEGHGDAVSAVAASGPPARLTPVACCRMVMPALTSFSFLEVNVHHQVSVDVAQPGHGAGGKHVQHHLLRSAGFHAARSGDDFGANFGHDGEMRGFCSGDCDCR